MAKNKDVNRTECQCSQCVEIVKFHELGFSTFCGTFCESHMDKHLEECEICRKEFK